MNVLAPAHIGDDKVLKFYVYIVTVAVFEINEIEMLVHICEDSI